MADMGENDVIFIAPINNWNPITRSDEVRLLVNQSIRLIGDSSTFQVQVTAALNISSPIWRFFSIAAETREHNKSYISLERSSSQKNCIKRIRSMAVATSAKPETRSVDVEKLQIPVSRTCMEINVSPLHQHRQWTFIFCCCKCYGWKKKNLNWLWEVRDASVYHEESPTNALT